MGPAHQPEPEEDGLFNLGKPINRKPEQELTPIEGRPNWFRDRHGNEKYVEPPPPPTDVVLYVTDEDYDPNEFGP